MVVTSVSYSTAIQMCPLFAVYVALKEVLATAFLSLSSNFWQYTVLVEKRFSPVLKCPRAGQLLQIDGLLLSSTGLCQVASCGHCPVFFPEDEKRIEP